MRIETLAVHAGTGVDRASRALTLPIHLSTTFERDEDGTYPEGFSYTRSGNPTRRALETCLAELEGGAAAAAFASGSAATAAVFQALEPGDHVIAPMDAYYGTPVLLRDHYARWGLQATFVDMSDTAAVQKAVTPRDESDLGRDAIQPQAPRHRHRGVRVDGEGGRRHLRGGQHLGHARPAASPRSRRGHRHAFDDEVSERAQRRAGWRAGGARRGRPVRARAGYSVGRGRRARAV